MANRSCSDENLNILENSQKALIKTLEQNVKNKWNFNWLEEEVKVQEFNVKLGDTIVKINSAGKALCQLCNSVINYGGRGKCTLKGHIKSDMHHNRLKVQKTNYNLGSFALKKDKLFPMFRTAPSKPAPATSNTSSAPTVSSSSSYSPASTTCTSNSPLPTVPLADRVATMEAMFLAVMAEHSMPLTIAPILVDLARAASRDPQALARLQLSPASAAYKIQYGLADTIFSSLIDDLKSTPFSLNIDEATSSNNKKVLSILVSFVKNSEVRLHHLASVELMRTNSESVYNAICAIFERNNLPWTNLVSVLFDSCAVMRGTISGVETRIRKEKAPHLLDIDGDSCHHMNNIVKRVCAPFGGYLEGLFTDLYIDFKWCTDQKSVLKDLCEILKIPYTVPQMCSSTRWLSAYDRAMETKRMLESLKIFYFSFLSKKDKDLYFSVIKGVMVNKGLVLSVQKKALDLIECLSSKKSTKDGKERKERITKKLFDTADQTAIYLEFYVSVLCIMKEYICVFQTKSPMIHKLHDFQVNAVRKFLQCFIRPEKMQSLAKLDVTDSSLHLPLRHIFIGHPNKVVEKKILETCLQSYIQGALQMKKTLGSNSTLESLSAIDPSFRCHTIIKIHLNTLSEKCVHLFEPEESTQLDSEIRCYVNDPELPGFNDEDRLDLWWTGSEVNKKYPVLCKMAKAFITIFHGAQVESTFSVMTRIVTKQTASISVSMLNAIQMIKYELMATKLNSLSYFYRNHPATDPVCHQLCGKMRSAWKVEAKKRESRERKKNIEDKLSKNTTSASAARKITALAKKRQMNKFVAKPGPPAKKMRLE